MSRTKIEWADAVWNPVTGCTPVSDGCQNCYARRFAHRLRGRCGYPEEEPFQVVLHPERLEQPRHWRKPRRVFVCSMGDLFHPDVPDTFLDRVFDVMYEAQDCTFLLLTKRPERMAAYIADLGNVLWGNGWDHVWLGVTAENQRRADERIPILLQIPASVRWVSCEPLLGPIDLHDYLWNHHDGTAAGYPVTWAEKGGIHWVVAGGETGPGARPCHPDWVRRIRDDCVAAGVPFFFKAWGECAPITERSVAERACHENREIVDPVTGGFRAGITDLGNRNHVFRVGRKAAGRLLDGRTWDEIPGVSASSSAE